MNSDLQGAQKDGFNPGTGEESQQDRGEKYKQQNG